MTAPIFFAYTRSFWFGLLAVVSVIAQDGNLMTLLSETVAELAGLEFEAVHRWTTTAIPALATIAALQQRSGAARPYTVKPTKESLT